MTKTETKKLNALCGNGYCKYATAHIRVQTECGKVVQVREGQWMIIHDVEQLTGWFWMRPPNKARFIGENYAEAREYFE